jgi:hypothetical protein
MVLYTQDDLSKTVPLKKYDILKLSAPLFWKKTVDTEAYRYIITQFCSLVPLQEQDCWIQQDDAAYHMTRQQQKNS